MPEYRLFRFHSVSGLASEEVIPAANDNEAKQIARDKAEGAACELWLDRRLVALINAAHA